MKIFMKLEILKELKVHHNLNQQPIIKNQSL